MKVAIWSDTNLNLAGMKLSAWHKDHGDEVERYNNMFSPPGLLYKCKVFKFTDDLIYHPDCEAIKGGTGYDLTTKLSDEIEHIYPDYSLYALDCAVGFTSRGCSNTCSFCVVWEKEGRTEPAADIYEFWRDQENIMLLDGNLTSHPEHFERVCKQLIKEGVRVDFSQGLDIRLVDRDKATLIHKLKRWRTKTAKGYRYKQWHFAFDDLGIKYAVERGVKLLKSAGVSPSALMFYVLVGYNSTMEDDMERIEFLESLGVDPFVMPYNKSDPYQAALTRWCNRPAIRKSCRFHEYKRLPVELKALYKKKGR